MKRKKRSLGQRIYKHKRLYILILVIAFIVFLVVRSNPERAEDEAISTANFAKEKIVETTNSVNIINNEVEEEKEEEEKNILGQTKVENADGYTTEFSCSNTKYPKTYIEYKQNLGSWSQKSYWGGTMEENGCGITAISIIASGYGSKVTPETLRQRYSPHLDTSKIRNAFYKLGIKCTDFYFDSSYLNEKYITNWLESGRPIVVCVSSEEENRWTKLSHYMVLLDVNSEGEIYVSNPNGLDGTEKESNWYDSSEILPHVAKAMFIESYE